MSILLPPPQTPGFWLKRVPRSVQALPWWERSPSRGPAGGHGICFLVTWGDRKWAVSGQGPPQVLRGERTATTVTGAARTSHTTCYRPGSSRLIPKLGRAGIRLGAPKAPGGQQRGTPVGVELSWVKNRNLWAGAPDRTGRAEAWRRAGLAHPVRPRTVREAAWGVFRSGRLKWGARARWGRSGWRQSGLDRPKWSGSQFYRLGPSLRGPPAGQHSGSVLVSHRCPFPRGLALLASPRVIPGEMGRN